MHQSSNGNPNCNILSIVSPHLNDTLVVQNLDCALKYLPIFSDTLKGQKSNCPLSLRHMALSALDSNYFPAILSHPVDVTNQ